MENMNIFSEKLKEINSDEAEINGEADEDTKQVATSCINRAKLDTDLELEVNDDTDERSSDELWEFDDILIPKLKHKKKSKQIQTKKIDEQKESIKKELIRAITRCDTTKLQSLLGYSYECINQTLDDYSNTILHIAARYEQADVVKYLLERGADPCLKNKKKQTPYTCTKSKKVKEVFIQFARDEPDRYNYQIAQIPLDPDRSEEVNHDVMWSNRIMRRMAECEDMKREKLKMKKKEGLAAKRRLITQSGNIPCTFCSINIVGLVPVEYTQYLFCSEECLKVYKISHPVKL